MGPGSSLAFGDDDLEGTSWPHDDTLVMTSRIVGFFGKNGVDRSREWGWDNVSRPLQGLRVEVRKPH